MADAMLSWNPHICQETRYPSSVRLVTGVLMAAATAEVQLKWLRAGDLSWQIFYLIDHGPMSRNKFFRLNAGFLAEWQFVSQSAWNLILNALASLARLDLEIKPRHDH